MKVKELKKVLAKMPDDALIIVCDPMWKTSEVEGHQLVTESPIYNNQDVLYLDIR